MLFNYGGHGKAEGLSTVLSLNPMIFSLEAKENRSIYGTIEKGSAPLSNG
jgi:hypothetical protein